MARVSFLNAVHAQGADSIGKLFARRHVDS
ncbi:Uncharacterised protein [Vibrio cholerae]|nr:Uncharacterised protein [Vibrio cholerae]